MSSRIGMVGPALLNVVMEGILRPKTGFQAKINDSTAIKDPLTLEGKCIGLDIVKPQIGQSRGSRIARTNSMKLCGQG